MQESFNASLENLPQSPSSPAFTPYKQEAIKRGLVTLPKSPTVGSDGISSEGRSYNSGLSFSAIFKKAECRALILFLFFLFLFYIALVTFLDVTFRVDFVFFGPLEQNLVRTVFLDQTTGIFILPIQGPGTYFAVARSEFNTTTGQFWFDNTLNLDINGSPGLFLEDGSASGVADRIWMVTEAQVGLLYSLANLAWFENKPGYSYVGFGQVNGRLELETDTVIDFVRMIGTGSFVQLEEDKSYVATIFDDSLENEDVSAFASYFCTQDGVVLARGTNATDRDFSSRVFFTPSVTDAYVLRTRSSGLLTADNSTISAHISVKEIFPIEVSLENSSFISTSNDLKAASSTTYEIELLADMEYLFEISSEVTVPNNLIEKLSLETENSRFLLPEYFPGVGVTLYNKADNVVIKTFSSTIVYQDVSDILNGTVQESFISIEAEGPLEISFIPSEDLTVLLDVVTLNPNYLLGDPDFVIGTFNISMDGPGSAAPIESGPLLADPNAPFSTCESTGLDLILAGCNQGVYLFCRELVFPFEHAQEIPVEAADEICSCVSNICALTPANNIANSFFQPIKLTFYFSFAIIGLFGIVLASYGALELAVFDDFRNRMINQENMYGWFLCYLAFVMHSVYAFIVLRSQQIGTEFTTLFENWEQTTGYTDSDFYGVDPFEEITQNQQDEYVNLPFLNEEAVSSYNAFSEREIGFLSRSLFVLKLLLVAIAFLMFADAWSNRLSLISESTYIRRKKHMKDRDKRIFQERVVQFVLILSVFAQPLSVAANRGEGYSPYFYYVISACCFMLAAILFYTREKTRLFLQGFITSSAGTMDASRKLELGRVQLLMRETSIGVFFSALLMGISYLYLGFKLRTLADFTFNKADPVYEMFDIYANFGSFFAAMVMFRFWRTNHNHLKKAYILSVMRDQSEFRTKDGYSSTMAGQPSFTLASEGQRNGRSQYLNVHHAVGLGHALFGNPSVSRAATIGPSEVVSSKGNLSSKLTENVSKNNSPRVKYFVRDSEIDRVLGSTL